MDVTKEHYRHIHESMELISYLQNHWDGMERFSLVQLVIPNRILKKCPSERGTSSHSAEG